MTAVAVIAALGIGLSGLTQASATQAAQQLQPIEAPTKPGRTQRVTLITGDRVTLLDGDPTKTSVEPAAGRRQIPIHIYRAKSHLYVIPADVQEQLGTGRLDRQLFDVTGLLEAGYDDESVHSIPVIVTNAGQAVKRTAAPGATLTRQLPVLNGAAFKVDKSKTAGFLPGLSAARSRVGVEMVWLDRKLKLSLDQSVPQIGAPIAWQAGFTGKGVKVAVLDTGVDASHPDLATQMAGAKNFTEVPDGDTVGHGTHVASTIAGTGAASGGRYKGVAPDAKLYDGKVCADDGCTTSAIIAGMEWAATEVKADVVNLSIGGLDTPDIDPMEEAVNRLTEQTGTLFVIAAGNEGPGAGTVTSPGSADAALTVGAVDKQDRLADFSGMGPRVGDGAIKPDVTAPGVAIVAARAKDGVIGEPVGDRYASLDGTSMATPHTAGAAALLAQQHPDWKADDLKGALISTAKPAADQIVFQQGAGRIDVARAVKQAVIGESGNLSFGTAQWPHNDDEPVTKTLTYRNLGDRSVTLDLKASFNSPDGQPAPADAFGLSANTVTVPAGGTASVQAMSNTKHDGPDGAYSGRITAVAGDVSLTSAVSVDKEFERYTVTVKALGPDGKPVAPSGLFQGLEQEGSPHFFGSSTIEVKLRLPKNDYLIEANQSYPDADNPAQSAYYALLRPSLKLIADTTVVFDARIAKQVKVTVPQADAAVALAVIGYTRTSANGESGRTSGILLPDLTNVYTAQLGPPMPPEQMSGLVMSYWAKPSAVGRFDNSPYLYGQADEFPGRFPTGFVRDVQAKDLAVVHQQVNAVSDLKIKRTVLGKAIPSAFGWDVALTYDQPVSTKLLVDDKPAIWRSEYSELDPASPDPNLPDDITRLFGPDRRYAAGRTYDERFYGAPFSFTADDTQRTADEMSIVSRFTMDADGNEAFLGWDAGSSRLLRDGKVIAVDRLGGIDVTGLPAEKTIYTYESTVRPPSPRIGERIDYRWTFASAATGQRTRLPIVTIRYQPKLDHNNIADRTPVTIMPIVTGTQKDGIVPDIKKVELQVSGDAGRTWQPATVTPCSPNTYKAVFQTPKAAQKISLKIHMVDAEGNVTDQTTIGAYSLH